MSLAGYAVKGWCPGIARPMPSGDGLIVRVRPRCGALSLATVKALADLAERLGNGHVDLTRRANLQLRGLTEDALPELQVSLAELGLLDPDSETEAVRNVMVAPLAGLDPDQPFDIRPIAAAIYDALLSDVRLHALPSKFGILVDGGGRISIASERADICLAAIGDLVAFGLDRSDGTHWLGAIAPHRAAATAIAAAHAFLKGGAWGRMRDLSDSAFAQVQRALVLSPIARAPTPGRHKLGVLDKVAGIAAPFGRLDAGQLGRLADLAADAGIAELRLSPWRAFYAGARDEDAARALVSGARRLGLIVDGNDPLLQVEACPGAPDCASSSVDARGDARRVAAIATARDFRGSIHVSGCAKGCARSLASDLVLVGAAGAYGVVRHGTSRDPATRVVGSHELEALFDG
ncbi:precorrin-3B synthase [soil metagenome]